MDLFLDTEFIGFKELSPLSVGFCPLDNELPSAYFELAIDEPDISLLDEEGQFFMTTEVLAQIDRLILKRQPLLFGSGIPLFGDRPYRPERFDAVETTPYESGVVVTEYVRRRGE